MLTARMAGIGMNFATEPARDVDLELTLMHSSELGMDDGDLRALSMLTTWLGVHHPHVNADRLIRLGRAETSERVRAYWAAVAAWLAKDRRLARLRTSYRGRALTYFPLAPTLKSSVAVKTRASWARSCELRQVPCVAGTCADP
jgi:hypothetical protein